jgi:2-polyprenyl-3-methyl-5-hydroxy-6-metoxy-1,4-benzoquinol methylase
MTCRICKKDNLTFHFTARNWEFFKCVDCGYIQVVKKPENEEIEKIYSQSYFSHSKYGDLKTLQREYRRRKDIMIKYLGKGSSILDFGCAQADFINFAKSDFVFWGLDYSVEAISLAKQDFPELKEKLFTLNQINDLPDKYFKAVVIWDVLEHLWNPVELLSVILSKLDDNGFVFISSPKPDSFFAKLTGRFWPFVTPPEHLGFFSKKTIFMIADMLNLTVEERFSKGKWVNIGFLFYKLKRIFPRLVPNALIKLFQKKYSSKISLYIPTNDIQYIVLKKQKS